MMPTNTTKLWVLALATSVTKSVLDVPGVLKVKLQAIEPSVSISAPIASVLLEADATKVDTFFREIQSVLPADGTPLLPPITMPLFEELTARTTTSVVPAGLAGTLKLAHCAPAPRSESSSRRE